MSDSLATSVRYPTAPLTTQKRMSPTRALIWKQCADLFRSFVVLTAVSLVLFVFFAWATHKTNESIAWPLFVAAMFSIGFSLSACFVSFVIESESRTREFLVNLPVTSQHVGAIKLIVATLAVVVFFVGQVCLALMAVWLKGKFAGDVSFWGHGSEYVSQYWWAFAIVVGVVFVSSAISCSFWSTSWISTFSTAFLIWGLVQVCDWLDLFLSTARTDDPIGRYPMLLVAVLLSAIVLAIGLPLFWLRRRPLLRKRIASNVSVDHQENDFWSLLPSKLGITTPAWLAMPSRGRFAALCWQSVRQQMMLPLLAFLAIAVLAWAVYAGLGPLHYNSGAKMMQISLTFVLTMTGHGFGSASIYRDKLNSNLSFFHQHQEHGRELLLARIVFPLLLLIVSAALCNLAVYLLTGYSPSVWLPLLSGFAAFSATLMWSMAFRSVIYPLGVGLVLSLTMNGFIMSFGAEQAEFSHPWIAVLPFVWLATCFACAPTWLAGRRGAAWMAWFTFVSLATYAIPLWMLACWMLGVDPTAPVDAW
jgi:hypothetical protein